MNFSELSKTRESCRSFLEKDVEKDLIIKIIEQATLAPSACNSQPWKFVVCTGEKAKQIPSSIIKDDLPINLWTPQVPVFIVLCETKAKLMSSLDCHSQRYAAFDLGSAATSICLSAADMGLGTCIIGCFDDKKLKELTNIPSETVIRAVIALGYSKSDMPRNKIRKNIDDVLSFNNW